MRTFKQALVAAGLSVALVAGVAPAAVAMAEEGGGGSAGSALQAQAATSATDISDGYIELESSQVRWTGEEATPYIEDVYYYDEDGYEYSLYSDYYTVSYQDSAGKAVDQIVDPGEYKVVVTGVESEGYTGSLEAAFTVYKGYIYNTSISLAEDEVVYTGAAIDPGSPTVTYYDDDNDSTITLTEGQDYTVKVTSSWDEDSAAVTPKEAGVYYVHVIGKNGWLSSDYTWFSIIDSKDLANASANLRTTEYGYTGAAIVPVDPVVKAKSASGDYVTLTKGTDYTLTTLKFDENDQLVEATPLEVGEYALRITGTGSYYGTHNCYFNVYQTNSLDFADVTFDSTAYPYTGAAITPEKPVVKVNDKTLVEGTDYTIKITDTYNYGDDVAAVTPQAIGTYYMHIIGAGDYKDTHTSVSFRVYNAYDIRTADVSFADGKATYAATGQAINPGIVVSIDGKILAAGTDYEASWYQTRSYNETTGQYDYTTVTPTEPGEYSLRIVGLGKYAKANAADNDLVKSDFLTIVDTSDFGYADFIFDETSFAYTGAAITPEPVVLMNGKRLVKGTDYTLSYVKDVFGQEVAVNEPVEVGDYYVIVKGAGTYAGADARYLSFSIEQGTPISDATILSDGSYFRYTGSAITPPALTLIYEGKTLAEGTDYTVKYQRRTTRYNYNYEDYDYDYYSYAWQTVSASELVEPGTYRALIEGAGSYMGRATKSFTIYTGMGDFESADVTLEGDSGSYFAYTGSAITPKPKSVKINDTALVEGTDYKVVGYYADYGVAIDEPIEVGGYYIRLVGLGTYAGETASAYFSIVEPTSIALARVDMRSSFAYTGSDITPSIYLTWGDTQLAQGSDYTLVYLFNDPETGQRPVAAPKEVGSYSILILGAGNYTGEREVYFSVVYDLTEADITLDAEAYAYTGKVISPKVSVKLAGGTALTEGEDYRVYYPEGATDVGAHVAEVVGIGDYAGSQTIDFAITPTATALKKVTAGNEAFVATWTKVTEQNDGYEVAYGTKKGAENADVVKTVKKASTAKLTVKKLVPKTKLFVYIRTYKKVDGETYYSAWSKVKGVTPKVAAPKISKLAKVSKGFTATWKRASTYATGYQLRYSLKKSMKGAKTVKVNKTAKTLKQKVVKLKGAKKYYVQVRTVAKMGAKTYYSAWSAKKAVKTKK